jgi:hypothetical protein
VLRLGALLAPPLLCAAGAGGAWRAWRQRHAAGPAAAAADSPPPAPLHPTPAGATGEGLDLRIAVANGLGNAKKLVKGLQEGSAKYDFIEVCLGLGAGAGAGGWGCGMGLGDGWMVLLAGW